MISFGAVYFNSLNSIIIINLNQLKFYIKKLYYKEIYIL